MRKLTSKEQKKIMGGGPCGLKMCGDVIIDGAVYTGDCASTVGCSAAYITTICTNGIVPYTYCTTGLAPL